MSETNRNFEKLSKELKEMEEKTAKTADKQDQNKAPEYGHTFTDLIQILEYCKSIKITDEYLIQGLKNTINGGYRIRKNLLGGNQVVD